MNYRTTNLMNELSETTDSDGFKEFLNSHKEMNSYSDLGDFFNYYLKSHHNIDVTSAIRRSNLDRGYAYQILNGRKPHPGKYKLVMLCICIGMKLKDIQRALTISGCAVLYPKINLDAALIVCINNEYNSAIQVNEFLSKNNMELIQ